MGVRRDGHTGNVIDVTFDDVISGAEVTAKNGTFKIDLKRFVLTSFKDDDGPDWIPAFNNAFSEIKKHVRAGAGAELILPYSTDDYYLSDDLNIEMPLTLRGAGAWNGVPASRLQFAAGKGIKVWGYNSPSGVAAQCAKLRDFGITNLGFVAGVHAVHAFTACDLEGLHAGFFDGGYRMQTGLPSTNANDFVVRRCVATNCRYGFWFNGGDTNTFLVEQCTIFAATIRAVLDQSFLGGTWFRCHSEGCTGPLAWEVAPVGIGSHVMDCYSEDTGPSRIVSPSYVTGPQAWAGGFTDDSNVPYVGNESRGIQFVGKGTPANYPLRGPYTVRKQIGHVFSLPQPWVERLGVEGAGADPYKWDIDGYDDATGYPHHYYDGYGGSGNVRRLRATSLGVILRWPMAVGRMVSGSSVEPGYRYPLSLGLGDNKIVTAPPGVTADPTTDTWNPGDVWILGDGGASGWWAKLCTVMGSQFAYGDGLTATANGTNVIVLSGPNVQLMVGDVVSIGGGAARRVTALAGTSVTLTGAGINAGSGLSIATVPATFKRMGALET